MTVAPLTSQASGRMVAMIHGMWGTPAVWDNWRRTFEERGWHVMAPALRHHDAPPLEPPPELGETSLLDYADDLEERLSRLPARPVIVGHSMGGLLAQILAARGQARAAVLLTPAAPAGVLALRPSVVRAFLRAQTKWGWWRKAHRPTFDDAMWACFNTTPRSEAGRSYGQFVHESGRVMLEIGLPWFDRRRAAHVDPGAITVPLLVVGCGRDRLTPPGVVRRIAARYAHVAEHHEFPDQGHWVLGQRGWEQVATLCADWLDRTVEMQDAAALLVGGDARRAWRASLVRR